MSEGADSDGAESPTFSHSTFLSPFSWRYGSPDMRRLWSEEHRRRLMRRVWVALAEAQMRAGLVSEAQVADLRRHVEDVDLARAQEIEREIRHDVMAEIQTFAEQSPLGGAILHWGATSNDIIDNVDVLRIRAAARLLEERLEELLLQFAELIEATAETPVMAYTHIQPAEPTTLGYRFAVYAQDLLHNLQQLRILIAALRGKGLKGAVGTQASFQEIVGQEGGASMLEEAVMEALELPYFPIATQTYPRGQDLHVMQVLAAIAASLHKLALDFRLLQSPPFGEWQEPFGARQVGSSAMPFKRNPINMENVCSLARFVGALPAVAWDNASQAVLERSLDDSANRRLFLPEGFLAVDELLRRTTRIVAGMTLDEAAMARNMARYGPFAATERLLMRLVAAGADRQEAHEWIREASMEAWERVQAGVETNPLTEILADDVRIRHFMGADELDSALDATAYVGTAPERAVALAEQIRAEMP